MLRRDPAACAILSARSLPNMACRGVEEQFYLCFPMLMLLVYGKRAVATAPLHGTRFAFIALASLLSLVACAALSYMQAAHALPRLFDMAFYLMPSRLWQLAAGALLFHVQVRPWIGG